MMTDQLELSDQPEITKKNWICSPPPPISPTIKLDGPDRAYLYRAIIQGKTELAIKWLDRWKGQSLTESCDRLLVRHMCQQQSNKTLLAYLEKNKLLPYN